jgi:hypothetical protein
MATKKHRTSEASVRRLMIKHFAKASEPVDWDITETVPGRFDVDVRVPGRLRTIFARFDDKHR